MSHDFLTLEEAVAMHDAAIREFGGAVRLQGEGALVSALMRPQVGYYDGLIKDAGAMLGSKAMNHPVVDGNRLTAFYSTDTFLRKNGSFIDCEGESAHGFFMGLFETNSLRFAELRGWLAEDARTLPGL